MGAPAASTDPGAPLAEPLPEPRRFAGLRRLFADPLGLAGLTLVALFLTSALLAPWIAPYDPSAIDVRARLGGPSLAHLPGTDQLGRDTFSRVLHGGRVALQVAAWSISASLARSASCSACSQATGRAGSTMRCSCCSTPCARSRPSCWRSQR